MKQRRRIYGIQPLPLPDDPRTFIQLALNEHSLLLESEGVTLAEAGFENLVMDDFNNKNWTIHPSPNADAIFDSGVYVMLHSAPFPRRTDHYVLSVAPKAMGLYPDTLSA